METAKYLCEFFFCDGFDSFCRLLIVAGLFWCLSSKTYNYTIIGTDEEKEND
jgi:hypothetical protein